MPLIMMTEGSGRQAASAAAEPAPSGFPTLAGADEVRMDLQSAIAVSMLSVSRSKAAAAFKGLQPDCPRMLSSVLEACGVPGTCHAGYVAEARSRATRALDEAKQLGIEPIALGKATIVGPHVDNFLSTVEALRVGRGIVQVSDASDLSTAVRDLLSDPVKRRGLAERGRAVIRQQQGATARHVELIDGLLQSKR